LEDLLSSVLSQFKKYHPSGNLKFNNLGIFPRLKLRISMEKILPISLKLNFTANTLGGYGLKRYSMSKPDYCIIKCPKGPRAYVAPKKLPDEFTRFVKIT